jgi:hypothetical protein
MNNNTCPCCGYKTMDTPPSGSYDICPVCFWEDDLVQFKNPNHTGGANFISLKQGQQNFILFGACEMAMVRSVRKPLPDEPKDPDWKPF